VSTLCRKQEMNLKARNGVSHVGLLFMPACTPTIIEVCDA
jgi:hypothetical protein